MFTIRAHHLEALRSDRLARLPQELCRQFRELYPELVDGTPDVPLILRLRDAVRRAGSYGIEDEGDLTLFALMTFTLGEHFDTAPEHAWAGQILRDPRVPGPQKVARIQEAAPADDESDENRPEE